MVTENSGTIETTGTESGASSSQPATQETSAPETQEAAPAEGSTDPSQPVKPAYTPNYKFKSMGKEQEFDEFVRAAIKDEASEKKIRDIYEKAYGLDHLKTDRQRLKDQTTLQQNEIARHSQVVNNVNHMLATKDYDNLFANVLKIPDDDILRHAKRILDLREMPPEQRQAYEQGVHARHQALELQNQNQYLMQSHEQVAVTARTQELDWTMQRPQISQLATAYDTRVGKEGAFRQAVIERGQYHALVTKRDVSAEEAINEVVNFLGGPQNLMPPVQAAPQVAPDVGQAQASKPVITNFQGRGTSPTKKVIKSLDDLRKRREELEA